MEKALKKYQESYKKFNQGITECEERKKDIERQIQDIKSGLKENVKKGKIGTFLAGGKVDTLSKLLAESQVIEVELEALNELKKSGETDVVRKALYFLDKVETKNNEVAEEFQKKREEAQKMIEEGKKMAMQYSHMSQIADTSMRINQAKYELNGVLDSRMTVEDKRTFTGGSNSIQQLRDILNR